MDNEQKITTDIKVPNKNMEVLKKHFGQCFDKNGNFDIEKFKQELSENEIDFYKESYGLDWLGKSYARILASDEATTLLKEDEEHNQKDENKDSQNLLIKGDNLEVLKHLSNAYYEKIKMIYIDPPYNTGSDGFVYQDNRKFTIDELKQLAGVDEEKAKRILDFTQSKSNSHSAWLTFMYPRLYIAKQLLKDDGLIFISIDDNEVAQLRLLMDEVFGEENFVGNLIWLNQEGGGGSDSKHFRLKHEYILCFSNNVDELLINGVEISNLERYTQSDKYENQRGKYYLQKLGMGSIQYSSSLDYEITMPDGIKIKPADNNNGKKACWRWSKEKYNWGLKNDFIEFKKDREKQWQVYTKQYLKCDNEGNFIERQNRPTGVIEKFSSTQASKKIQELFSGNKIFSYPKPYDLISYLISLSASEKNDIILDFFAGSGTTGDAVMQLNAEDGGNRNFILVQLPEPIDKKKSKTAYDFVKDELKISEPTIFEITKERLIRASKKIKEETITSKIANKEKEITELNGKLDLDNKDEKIQQLKTEIENLKNQDLGFRIFETTPIWDDYGFEADELNPQLKIFDESTLSEEDIKALLITWKTYDGITLTEPLIELDFGGYIGYFADKKLYLMDKGFSTENLKNLLEKIDTDKEFNPTSIVAFGYNFDSKNLREISENIKSYAN
ncbi:site-specific DNA-methyltransferase [Natronoflexus pectinivorans]|uniref:site-specific DNA-methyltransferase (adenine-specific) n=1 Tax=Natronoflexus pectinivorans TaxID=682526 RepID=A0A4R2GH11_9BACT|nr:site-specific DNA-methyltransferase [Natronoflexus pectinivorans]TCO07067.1 adenine-specific DNA-methyltransferase [Natronoflexus pectinivorans]